jgi:hypothetical protein
LESYSLPNTYLTQSETNLRFTTGTVAIRDKFGNKTSKIGIEQCFIVNKSTVGTGGEDIPIFLETASKADYLITLTNNYFELYIELDCFFLCTKIVFHSEGIALEPFSTLKVINASSGLILLSKMKTFGLVRV